MEAGERATEIGGRRVGVGGDGIGGRKNGKREIPNLRDFSRAST